MICLVVNEHFHAPRDLKRDKLTEKNGFELSMCHHRNQFSFSMSDRNVTLIRPRREQ
jgi:hypothetical protein